jgi:hypothetical protein
MTNTQVESIFNDGHHFRNEREMSDYIHLNIKVFCSEILGDEYRGHRRELEITGAWSKSSGKPKPVNTGRVDFYIHGKKKNYVVEIKNPVQVFSELTKSIGQILVYRELMNEVGDDPEFVLVSSKHAGMVDILIKKYNLGIRYIVFNKEMAVEAGIHG